VLNTCSSEDDLRYQDFLKRAQADEAYIGFFAAEDRCLFDTSPAYFEARRQFFLSVDTCKEDPEEFIEPFLEFCENNQLIKTGHEDEWEKYLTILSYELYGNTPIFEYPAGPLTEHRNLVFAEYANKKLELDLFLPTEGVSEPLPCIVCIHGGGFRVNRRIWFEPFAQYLADRGFAAATIDYRLIPAVELMDCINDSKAAIRWVRANAAKYGIDPDRIGVIGASAGAHLVTLLGTTADVAALEGAGGNPGISSAVQAVVGIASPSLSPWDLSRRAERYQEYADAIELISPYANASSASAPLYLIHGTTDETVEPENSQELYDRYREVGAQADLTWIPGEGHGFYEGNDVAIKMAADFFKRVFFPSNEDPRYESE